MTINAWIIHVCVYIYRCVNARCTGFCSEGDWRGKKRDRWSCGKKRINIESYRGGGGDRGIGNSRAIWQKVIVRTFDDFIIPGGRRCPLFRSVLWSPVFDARSVKRETVSREGEQWRGIETRYTTTQRWFLHGRARSIGPYKTVSLFLSISFILSSRCSVYSQSGCDFSEASMSKVGKTFNGTNSTEEGGEELAIFSSDVSSAALITRTALWLHQSLSWNERSLDVLEIAMELIDLRKKEIDRVPFYHSSNSARKLSKTSFKSYDLLSFRFLRTLS